MSLSPLTPTIARTGVLQGAQPPALWVTADMSQTQIATYVAELIRETGRAELRASGSTALNWAVKGIALAKCVLYAEHVPFDVDVKSANMDCNGLIRSGMRFSMTTALTSTACFAA